MFSHLPNHFKGHRKPHRATGQNIARGTTQKCLSGRGNITGGWAKRVSKFGR